MSGRPEESELPERLVGLSTAAGRAGLAAQELQRVGGQERRVLGNQAELRDVEAAGAVLTPAGTPEHAGVFADPETIYRM